MSDPGASTSLDTRAVCSCIAALLFALQCCLPPLPQPSACEVDGDCPAGYECHKTLQVCEPTLTFDSGTGANDAVVSDRTAPDTASRDTSPRDLAQLDAALTDSGLLDAVALDSAEPDAAQADVAQADTAQADVAQPDAAQADAAQADTAQADAAQADAAQPDAAQPDAAQADAAQADAAQADAALPDTCVPVNGGWTDWSWSSWTNVGGCGDYVSCRQRREHTGTRFCTDPTPSCGGDDCAGSDTTSETSDSEVCTILYWKFGNNGAVSCDTFCEDDEHWTFAGPPGTCVFADERIDTQTNRQDCDYVNPSADSLDCRCERCDP